MKWYVAELIVRCRIAGKREDQPLYDRQIKLLRAADHESAYRRALQLGQQENYAYLNPRGGTVYWEFLGIADLDELLEQGISDGTEIHSRFQRGNAKTEVRRKRDLAVFWFERNQHRTARELIQDEELMPKRIVRSRPARKAAP